MATNLHIKRESNSAGSTVSFRIFIDDNQIDVIGNNQEKTLSIPSGSHKIQIKLWNGRTSPSVIVDAEDGETISLNCGVNWKGGLFINKTISRLASPRKFKEIYSNMTKNKKENATIKLLRYAGFLLLSVFGGLITGLTFGVIGSFLYLIILFPIIMGITAGTIITENIKYTKVRNIYLTLLSSALTVLTLYISFHFMRYTVLSGITAFQVAGDFSDKSLQAGKAIVEYTIKQETGYSGFPGYILFKAQQGVSIGKIYSSNKLNLGPIFTWIYWLIEIGIIGFITINAGKRVLKKPFCEFCNSWYTEKKHIGGIPATQEAEILDHIKRKDFANVGAMLAKNADSPSLELYLQYCNTCDKSDSFLKITSAKFTGGKLTLNEMSEITLESENFDFLVEGIKYPLI